MSKMNLNFPDELLQEVTEYGKKLNISRTSAIAILVTRGLQAEKGMDLINQLMEENKKAKEKL